MDKIDHDLLTYVGNNRDDENYVNFIKENVLNADSTQDLLQKQLQFRY